MPFLAGQGATPGFGGIGGNQGGFDLDAFKVDDMTAQIDGVVTEFTLQNTPAAVVSMCLNGNALRPQSDYTVDGATVTLLVGWTPQEDDTLVAVYFI
jgi:hypothetical protein